MSLNPLNDISFKKVFGDKKNKHLLIELLNTIVSKEDQIDDLEIVNPEVLGELVNARVAVLDILAKSEVSGKQYSIEVQIRSQPFYVKRALFYWSRLYTAQLYKVDKEDKEEKEDKPKKKYFTDLNKTIAIHILDFNYFKEFKDYHNIFHIRNTNEPDIELENFSEFEMHFLEVKKFKKGLKELSPGLDKWLEFLKNASNYRSDSLPEELNSQVGIKDAMYVFETAKFTEKEQRAYEALEKQIMDEEARMYEAENKSREEGREEGRQEGEKNATIKFAKGLKEEGMSIERIIKLTGLTEEEINSII